MSVNIRNPITGELTNASGGVINPKSINEMIAPVEDGTASKPYAVGEQFIMNDLLCEATQAIAQGDTMVIGTNCEESEQLSKQVKDINSNLTVYYDSTDGKFYQLVNGQKGSEIEVGQKLPNYVVDVMGYNGLSSGTALCTYIADNVNGTQLLVSGGDTLTQDKLNSDYILSSNPNIYYATFTVQKDCWFYPNNDPVPTLLPTGSTIQVGYAASGSNIKALEGTFCFYN